MNQCTDRSRRSSYPLNALLAACVLGMLAFWSSGSLAQPATSEGTGASTVGVQLLLQVDTDVFEPANPGEARLRIVLVNGSAHPVKVPEVYDGDSILLYGQGNSHRHASYLVIDRPPAAFRVLVPGDEALLLDIALVDLLTGRRGERPSGEPFWTWMAHPMPPLTPVYQLRDAGFETKVDLWAELRVGTVTYGSPHVEMRIRSGSE